MCGIFGAVSFGNGRPVAGERLSAGFARTAERGPDGTGRVVFRAGAKPAALRDGELCPDLGTGDALLAHHRLAIVDVVDQANQPMRNEDGTVWVVFNGEIYNAPALRQELARLGHSFLTERSDTEALVHGWEQWGRELPSKVSGIFAAAILDFRRDKAGELTLLRDFPGTKPLYFTRAPGFAAFGSTATAVATAADVRSLDPEAVTHWLAYGYSPADQSLFKSVEKVHPGTGLTLRLSDGRSEVFSFRPKTVFGEAEFSSARFESVFTDVLRDQLHADVPVGFYLSGGVDSALVAAYARRLFPTRPLDCFSMRFGGQSHDESPYSAKLADKLGLTRHVVEAPRLSLSSIAPMIAAMDEPISDPSFFATWHLSKAIGRSLKVCVGGDGGDELFSGYERYQIAMAARARGHRWPMLARLVRAGFSPLVASGRLGRKAVAHLGSPAQVHLALETIGLSRFAPDDEARAAVFEAVDGETPDSDAALLERMQAHDLGAPLSEDILFKVDRTSMACHFEARVPFLDQRVVKYALSCSVAGNVSHAETKIPLRRLAGELGLSELLNPRKQGFGLDLTAEAGGISNALTELGGARRSAMLLEQPAGFERAVRRPMSRWALLVLELWLRAQDL